MIDNKLQFYQTRAGYDAQEQAGNIPNDALVFVKDTHEIITHGEEGFGGNIAQIDSRIATAISGLDASVSKTAGADGLALSVTEVDGKVTAVNGSIAANTYDSYGSASAAQTAAATDATNKVDVAKTEIIGGATSSGNTLKKIEDRVSPLETAVGSGGSIDTRISSAVSAEATRAQEAEADRYTKSETYTKEEVNNLITTPSQEYVSVIATSQTTSVTDVLPATGAADTTYRVGNWDGTQYNDSVFSEYAWNGSAYIKLSTKSQIGEVYDISANHADTKYADLAAALGTNGANIPQNLRKGGMSIKFVQSSDNKYVQYRLMANAWSINISDWSFCGDNILVENPEFLEVKTDEDNKLIEGTRRDGTKVLGGSLKVGGIIRNEALDYSLERKLDKEGLDEEGLKTVHIEYNPEYIGVEKDVNDKFLAGFRKDNGKLELPTQQIPDIINDNYHLSTDVDANQNVIEETMKDGVTIHHTPHVFMESVDLKKGLVLPDGTFIDRKHNNNIDSIYDRYTYEGILNNLTRTPIVDVEGGGLKHDDYQRPLFLHFTDIHKSYNNVVRIMQFYELYRNFITDVILTGDIAYDNFNDYNSDFENIPYYKDCVLKSIGNHDVFDPTQLHYIRSSVDVYNKFFQGIEKWGVEYSQGKCYYYKDYPKANLRLVVIDIMRFVSPWDWGYDVPDVEQLEWLTNTLEDARVNGYSVIIDAHWAPLDPQTTERINTPFDDKVIDMNDADIVNHKSQILLSAVDNFINNGGEFVCWLGGHRHADLIGTTRAAESENKQLYIMAECATPIDLYSNYFRKEGTESYDAFNLMSVDTHHKIITIYRIGAKYNSYMQHKECVTIDYINKSLIF